MRNLYKISKVLLLLAISLFAYSCFDVDALKSGGDTTESGNFITGVLFVGADPISDATIYLYKKNAVASVISYSKVDSTSVDSEGMYEFEYTSEATLHLKAKYSKNIYQITEDFSYEPIDGYAVLDIDISTTPVVENEAVVQIKK